MEQAVVESKEMKLRDQRFADLCESLSEKGTYTAWEWRWTKAYTKPGVIGFFQSVFKTIRILTSCGFVCEILENNDNNIVAGVGLIHVYYRPMDIDKLAEYGLDFLVNNLTLQDKTYQVVHYADDDAFTAAYNKHYKQYKLRTSDDERLPNAKADDVTYRPSLNG